ncbi:hypothetical protein BU25DRAFT_461602 [Macroventuria anomochaeta]|uniref:Uncharacterized protein n=1 Tax=Macroventuria anomochaeta TaxID=301207 RepID=A0ACB6RR96_9PLEO|nr:uncharacterized protein BU25DRAFT_461602 [Macroventuria anomochaeta]KAF2623802.1 hypothetical protein BU25DRAFT_461602 [Macroventuria anomochaeta]
MSSIRNVLVAGATGSVGASILTALLAEPFFNVTILSCQTLSAKFPPGVLVVKVSDEYNTAELTSAFQGQDAVISALIPPLLHVTKAIPAWHKWDLHWQDSAPEVARLREQFDAGDFNATYGLLALSFSSDVDVGYDFEVEQEVWNDRLGLPKVDLEKVIADAIKLVETRP